MSELQMNALNILWYLILLPALWIAGAYGIYACLRDAGLLR